MEPQSIDPNGIEALQRQIADLQARLAAQQASVSGTGAAAQIGSTTLGQSAVTVDGDNAGPINTGLQFITHYHTTIRGRLAPEEIARQVAGYLRWLQARTENIELRGIERAGGAPVVLLPLETAYVPLCARWMRGGTDIALDEILKQGHRLVIIGGPGSGKTTVLLHIAWALASSLMSGQPDPARSRLGLLIEPNELPLPIFVSLASFARYRRNLAGNAPAREWTLAYFISHHLISRQADFDLPNDFFVQLLKDGQDVLLLLDGLDEVANEDERAEVRQSVEELVHGREAMRVVVTCRTIAYRSGRTALSANFREIAVQPLDFEQHIVPMVRQAYACIYSQDVVLRADRANDLLSGIRLLEAERRLRLGEQAKALLDSPLMVRLLLIVHFNNHKLPDERAELFDKAINALLQVDYGREESNIRELSTDWKLYRDMAQHLAFHMHQQGRDQGREIEELALKAALRQEEEFKPRIDDFLGHARQRGSVLVERGGIYCFIHMVFQEFLVARYLREITGGDSRDGLIHFLTGRLDDPWWREPILLLAGYMATSSAKAARDFLRALATKVDSEPNERFSAVELAGAAALESHDGGETIRSACAQRIVDVLSDPNALACSRSVLRARAGNVLAKLGDPRFDPQRFYLPVDDLLGFVRIIADPEFMIGTRRSDVERVAIIVGAKMPQHEINDTLTPTPEFYIARYPVTVAQFRAFIEAAQFQIGNTDALREPDSRPVRQISVREAIAYCDWLNYQLAHSPVLEHSLIAQLVREGGWQVTLPSELEWEKAARGGLRDAVFSWGDAPDPNCANYRESEIGDTSVVGCFPANGFGLYDMIGNVWELTRSLWGNDVSNPTFSHPFKLDDMKRENLAAQDNVHLVVRGGSWRGGCVDARCAYRYWYSTSFRHDYFGFRIILCSLPVL